MNKICIIEKIAILLKIGTINRDYLKYETHKRNENI